MPPDPPPGPLDSLREHSLEIRVRYQETDAQGRVHHGNYINYFEVGRVEFLRALGHSYRELEASGILLVVAEMHCFYHQPAYYDDLLQLTTRVARARGVRIEHQYELRRGDVLIVSGRSIVASVNRDGKVCRLPKFLQLD